MSSFSSSYEKAHKQIFSTYRKPINPPSSNETLNDFLVRAGFPDKSLEGHSREPHRLYFLELITKNPWINRIVEIGFNAGHSSLMFLDALANNQREGLVMSFDILAHNYVYYAKLYIDNKYPGKHILVGGDSNINVPTFSQNFSYQPFDLIFIDGDHTEEKAYQDILNMRAYAIPGQTLVIMDNVAPHCGFGIGVYNAWLRAINEGLIIHLSHSEIDNYRDGWVVFTYASNDYPIPFVIPESNNLYITNSDVGVPNIDKICRRIEVTELTKKIESTNNLQQLQQYGRELKQLESQGLDKVDDWATATYKKKYDQLTKPNINNRQNRFY